jgi:hypothetical protein
VPDTAVEPVGGGRYSASMEARVAVLEEIARSTAATLERIERQMDRIDRRIDRLENRIDGNFRWLLGIMLGGFGMTASGFAGILAVMAHGFHWF